MDTNTVHYIYLYAMNSKMNTMDSHNVSISAKDKVIYSVLFFAVSLTPYADLMY